MKGRLLESKLVAPFCALVLGAIAGLVDAHSQTVDVLFFVRRGEILLSSAWSSTFAVSDLQGRAAAGWIAGRGCQIRPAARRVRSGRARVHREGPTRIELTRAGGAQEVTEGLDLDLEASSAIFERRGEIVRADDFYGLAG